MKKQCKVTYLDHSGFLLETVSSYLLFDYWKGSLPKLSYDKPLYVFVSHAHHDHYSREIYSLESVSSKVRYILSSDICKAGDEWKMAKDVTVMDAHESKTIGACKVESLLSTDEGLAYLLEIDDLRIYHAGDLHWWEWPGEPEEENEAYIRAYKKEIALLHGRKLDIACVVLDPRQEEAGGRGMDTFLQEVGADYVFPMHVWGDYDLIKRYIAQKQQLYADSRLMEIEGPGQVFLLDCSTHEK